MNTNSRLPLKNFSPFLIPLILWIVLFEFIIPTNSFLPKPSLVLLSFPSLWKDYNLPANFISTFGCIYLSLLLALFFSKYLSNMIIDKKFSNVLDNKRNKGYLIFLIFVFLILSTIWFSDFYFLKLIFASALSTAAFTIKSLKMMANVDKNFVDSMQSLGYTKHLIQYKIVPKLIRPSQLNFMDNFQYTLWLILIIYEILIGGEGIGIMFKKIVEYKDLSAAAAMLLILGFMMLAINKIYSYSVKNFNYQFNHE